MSDGHLHIGVERIEAALARIEKAANARAFDIDRIRRRHETLRQRVETAIEALDSLILRQAHDDDREDQP
ncbi:hypothetical protein KY084_00610 [Stakelama sp. CBK3Z-3]|uniref:Uncharacterized protein n=1 Tax=Stakelama flava TaxID=2860338 RepID=A0ABS6XGQ3_9SPHN|nr:hypothetical protein [Stakelama flava]MBW4329380.1 hypothetical protein [Stakelama flava]